MRCWSGWAAVLSFGLLLPACTGDRPEDPAAFKPTLTPTLAPTRGYILISFDTVRADRLGAYGHDLDTSPNFDRLAERGILFERAFAQYPSTLTSHMCLFTGFYPQEHHVLPPSTVLAESIETMPERFLANGFRTAGHTEGGFVAGGYGFRRGFEQFTDTAYSADTDIERTFERGLEFLRGLEPGARFFLFLHTYSVHDPYEPPEQYRELFWQGPPPEIFESSGENLRLVNRGELEISNDGLIYFQAMYDASVRYADDVLGGFVASLEEMGLMSETTLVITSDHGEEFMEHGKVAHTQIYPESLQVPLLIVHPDRSEGQRIDDLVELVDVAPTLYELAGLEVPATLSGRSLVEHIDSRPQRHHESQAYAEVLDVEFAYTLLARQRDQIFQLLMVEPELDPTGSWIRGSVAFDTEDSTVSFEAHSFYEPRRIRVVSDGEDVDELVLGTDWSTVQIELPEREGIQRVVLEADGCRSPAEVGEGEDGRCLAFQVRNFSPRRFELYDLVADPEAQDDLYRSSQRVRTALQRRLLELEWNALEKGGDRSLSSAEEETLKALGYLD